MVVFCNPTKDNYFATKSNANNKFSVIVTLGYGLIKLQQTTTIHMTHNKPPTYRKDYIFFKHMEELYNHHSVNNHGH